MQIADHMVKYKATDDLVIWQWLLGLVETLGIDGMSSEESEGDDDTEITFHVKTLPWRRNITEELQIIDNMRLLEKGIFAPQGSKPVKRLQGTSVVSTREAAMGLPRTLYDESWLRLQPHPNLKPNVSERPFKWLNIMA